jgi:hypothetical protein
LRASRLMCIVPPMQVAGAHEWRRLRQRPLGTWCRDRPHAFLAESAPDMFC